MFFHRESYHSFVIDSRWLAASSDDNRKTLNRLSLGPISAEPFYEFIDDEVKLSKDQFAHGIFDLSQRVIENIENDNTLFAIDQQPYLQGNMTVQLLFWKAKYQLRLLSETKDPKIISTGPIFVKKDDINQLLRTLVGQYR